VLEPENSGMKMFVRKCDAELEAEAAVEVDPNAGGAPALPKPAAAPAAPAGATQPTLVPLVPVHRFCFF
jgi:hypothetical protein